MCGSSSGRRAEFLEDGLDGGVGGIVLVDDFPPLSGRAATGGGRVCFDIDPIPDLIFRDEIHPQGFPRAFIGPDAIVQRGPHARCAGYAGEVDEAVRADGVEVEVRDDVWGQD